MAVSSCWKDWNSASLSYHTGDCQLNVRIYPDVIGKLITGVTARERSLVTIRH
jgi:hypothetical protein